MSCDDMWEGLGRRIIPPRELERMDEIARRREAAREAYHHWRALRRIAADQHWHDILPRLDEIELMIPDTEQIG